MFIPTQKHGRNVDPQNDTNQTQYKKMNMTRQNQLKMVLLFGLLKNLHQPHESKLDYDEQISNRQNLERATCAVMAELNQKIKSKLKQKELTKRVNIKQKSKMEKQNSQIVDGNSKFSVTLPAGFKQKQQHRQENNHFQKMSLLIDRKDKKCSLKQSVQNLIILGSSITKVKTLIYKHYKVIIEHKEQHQISAIKYYCLTIFTHFKELIILIESNVDKNQNYKKYLCSLKKFEPSISKQTSTFEQYLQCLLFYFSSIIQLKRFYEVCSNSEYFINKIHNDDVSNITQHIIRIRHYLGFLAKFIANPLIHNSDTLNIKSVAVQDRKDIWKVIYQKKYTSKVSKNICR